jgi:hypothetical protein
MAELKHTIRTKGGKTKEIENYTRGLAIKLQCLECLGWESNSKNCSSPLCPLYPFSRSHESIPTSKPKRIIPEAAKIALKKYQEDKRARKETEARLL